MPRQALEVPSSPRTLCREARILALVERQHGVVALRQLTALGLSASGVRNRVADGRLRRVHRAVYALGRRLSPRGRWMAAVLACGPDAVLSHCAAADLHGLLASDRLPDVTATGRPMRGLHRHTSVTLSAADRAVVEGIPCTTVARTLVDLGDLVPQRRVERALEQAEVLRVLDMVEVHDVLARAGPRRGAARLRAVLGDLSDPTLTHSELEERFLVLCRSADLAQPAVNAWVQTRDRAVQVDFLWRGEKLVVETDGRAFHATAAAYGRDRRRDRALTLAGYEPIRFTWREVVEEQGEVLESVQGMLARLAQP